MFTLGIVIGFVLGAKATRDAIALEQRKAAEREERKARRQARGVVVGSGTAQIAISFCHAQLRALRRGKAAQ